MQKVTVLPSNRFWFENTYHHIAMQINDFLGWNANPKSVIWSCEMMAAPTANIKSQAKAHVASTRQKCSFREPAVEESCKVKLAMVWKNVMK